MMSTDATARRDFGHIYQRGDNYWIRYSVGSKRYRESSGSTSRREAEKLLARRQAELGLGQFTAPDMKRTTFEDLARIITDDYAVNGRRSGERLQQSLARLRSALGDARTAMITPDRLTAYVRERFEQGAAVSTARNELNALRRAFRLAKRAGRVAHVPDFPQLTVHNTRTGFFEDSDFRAVLGELPPALRPALEFAYLTGWRVPSEVLPLTWAQVDFSAGIVRLEVGTTKNREGRVFPFRALPALDALLQAQREHTRSTEKRLGQIIPWVFHRSGVRIRDLYAAWNSACRRAAVERNGALERVVRPELLERIPHDLRRTAVRNLERAGVSRSVAMKLTGHKTESVYRRYAIVAEADLREGVAKLATLHGARGTDTAQSTV
jgi:integrase